MMEQRWKRRTELAMCCLACPLCFFAVQLILWCEMYSFIALDAVQLDYLANLALAQPFSMHGKMGITRWDNKIALFQSTAKRKFQIILVNIDAHWAWILLQYNWALERNESFTVKFVRTYFKYTCWLFEFSAIVRDNWIGNHRQKITRMCKILRVCKVYAARAFPCTNGIIMGTEALSQNTNVFNSYSFLSFTVVIFIWFGCILETHRRILSFYHRF